MDMLKDLPSYNSENFSKFSQGSSKSPIKSSVCLKSECREENPRRIVTDNETLLHKELEMLALRTKRKTRKRTSGLDRYPLHSTLKQPRIETESLSVDSRSHSYSDRDTSSTDSGESMT